MLYIEFIVNRFLVIMLTSISDSNPVFHIMLMKSLENQTEKGPL